MSGKQYRLSYTTLFLTSKSYSLSFNLHKNVEVHNKFPYKYLPFSRYKALVMNDLAEGRKKFKQAKGLFYPLHKRVNQLVRDVEDPPQAVQAKPHDKMAELNHLIQTEVFNYGELPDETDRASFYDKLSDILDDLSLSDVVNYSELTEGLEEGTQTIPFSDLTGNNLTESVVYQVSNNYPEELEDSVKLEVHYYAEDVSNVKGYSFNYADNSLDFIYSDKVEKPLTGEIEYMDDFYTSVPEVFRYDYDLSKKRDVEVSFQGTETSEVHVDFKYGVTEEDTMDGDNVRDIYVEQSPDKSDITMTESEVEELDSMKRLMEIMYGHRTVESIESHISNNFDIVNDSSVEADSGHVETELNGHEEVEPFHIESDLDEPTNSDRVSGQDIVLNHLTDKGEKVQESETFSMEFNGVNKVISDRIMVDDLTVESEKRISGDFEIIEFETPESFLDSDLEELQQFDKVYGDYVVLNEENTEVEHIIGDSESVLDELNRFERVQEVDVTDSEKAESKVDATVEEESTESEIGSHETHLHGGEESDSLKDIDSVDETVEEAKYIEPVYDTVIESTTEFNSFVVGEVEETVSTKLLDNIYDTEYVSIEDSINFNDNVEILESDSAVNVTSVDINLLTPSEKIDTPEDMEIIETEEYENNVEGHLETLDNSESGATVETDMQDLLLTGKYQDYEYADVQILSDVYKSIGDIEMEVQEYTYSDSGVFVEMEIQEFEITDGNHHVEGELDLFTYTEKDDDTEAELQEFFISNVQTDVVGEIQEFSELEKRDVGEVFEIAEYDLGTTSHEVESALKEVEQADTDSNLEGVIDELNVSTVTHDVDVNNVEVDSAYNVTGQEVEVEVHENEQFNQGITVEGIYDTTENSEVFKDSEGTIADGFDVTDTGAEIDAVVQDIEESKSGQSVYGVFDSQEMAHLNMGDFEVKVNELEQFSYRVTEEEAVIDEIKSSELNVTGYELEIEEFNEAVNRGVDVKAVIEESDNFDYSSFEIAVINSGQDEAAVKSSELAVVEETDQFINESTSIGVVDEGFNQSENYLEFVGVIEQEPDMADNKPDYVGVIEETEETVAESTEEGIIEEDPNHASIEPTYDSIIEFTETFDIEPQYEGVIDEFDLFTIDPVYDSVVEEKEIVKPIADVEVHVQELEQPNVTIELDSINQDYEVAHVSNVEDVFLQELEESEPIPTFESVLDEPVTETYRRNRKRVNVNTEDLADRVNNRLRTRITEDELGVGKLPEDPPWGGKDDPESPTDPDNPDDESSEGKLWLTIGKHFPAWNNWDNNKTR